MRKRVMSLALAAAMVMSMGACGKNDNAGEAGKASVSDAAGSTLNESMEVPSESTVEMTDPEGCVFKLSDEKVEFEGVEGLYESIRYMGDKVVLDTYEWNEESSSEKERLYLVPSAGGAAQCIYESGNPDSSIQNIVGVDGKIYVENLIYEDDKDTVNYELIEFDSSGKEVGRKDASFMEGSEDQYLASWVVTGSGKLVCIYDTEIKIFDESGKEKNAVKTESTNVSGCLDKNGNVVIISNGDNNHPAIAKILDAENGAFIDAAEIEHFPINLYNGSGKYDFTYRAEDGIYGYNMEEKTEVLLCDFTASEMATSYIRGLYMLDENSLIYIEDNMSGENPPICKYVKADPSEVKEKTELTLMCHYCDPDIEKEITNFNRNHPDVRIRIIEYRDSENAQEDMSLDIAAGNIPDLYFFGDDTEGLSLQQLMGKGMLEDMTPFLESDPELSETDFVPSVFNAMKQDGKLYFVSPFFQVSTFVASDADLGGKQGWTFDEMKQYIESKPEDTRIFYSTSKDENLDSFLYCCGSSFVDWEKGECYYNSQDFKDLLEMCNRGDSEETDWVDIKTSDYLAEGKQLFGFGQMSLNSFRDYQTRFPDGMTVVGYPDKDGQGVYACFNTAVAMSSKCADKEAAWEFIRIFLTEDYVKNIYSVNDWNSVRADVLENQFRYKTATEEYDDEYGNHMVPQSCNPELNDLGDDILLDYIKPVTQETLDEYKNTINRISKMQSEDVSLKNIIKEEVGAYFAGDKSVDEVCEIIQNRASIYIQENR